MDPRQENWRLSSMGWSEVVREVSMDDLIGRPRGDGGRFWRPWSGWVGFFMCGVLTVARVYLSLYNIYVRSLVRLRACLLFRLFVL